MQNNPSDVERQTSLVLAIDYDYPLTEAMGVRRPMMQAR